MPWRIQNVVLGYGSNKQSAVGTASSSFLRFPKLDESLYIANYGTEDDAPEIGKGNEFIQNVYGTAWQLAGSLEKFGSAEFITWAWAYALGNIAYSGGIYTLLPVDPATTLELPYFSIVQQGSEGGSSAVDETLLDCQVEEVMTVFNAQPGRESVKTTVNFLGTGRRTTPSGVVVPATLTEHYMLAQSMSVTINGTDYVANKAIRGGTMGWKNNLQIGPGYYPGSGVVSGAAVAGRILIGARVPTFTFRAYMLNNSPEYAALIAQTTGTAVIALTFDSTHTTTWTWEKISYRAVTRGQENGLVVVDVTVAPKWDTSNGILSISSQCGVTTIGQ